MAYLRGLSNLADGLALRVGLRIDRAKRGTRKRKAVSVAEASEQHTARYTGILVCIEHHAPVKGWISCNLVMQQQGVESMVRLVIARLARKHLRQGERDHPGYDVETQKYL